MRNYLSITLLVLLAIMALGQISSERATASQNVVGQKWEYQVAQSSEKNLNQPQGPNSGYDSFQHWVEDPSGLNGWGEQGWELVSIVRATNFDYERNLLFYFKRPKR